MTKKDLFIALGILTANAANLFSFSKRKELIEKEKENVRMNIEKLERILDREGIEELIDHSDFDELELECEKEVEIAKKKLETENDLALLTECSRSLMLSIERLDRLYFLYKYKQN